MAETCKGMMEKPGSGFWMIIPGLVFIILGVSIILYPQILVWLVAIALVVIGVAMLVMVNFMRNIGKRIRNTHG
ncbi:MAG: hypothetical protein ACE5FV_14245 [Woeseia sp.]